MGMLAIYKVRTGRKSALAP